MTEIDQDRRKKTTLRKIGRKNQGRVTQPYKLLEMLISEDFPQLKLAKIVICWKSGWKANRDGLLCHAQVRRLTELDRELWGDEYELVLLLHRELWQSKQFGDKNREADIYHELCHIVPDEADGEQKTDDRGRRCWRLRNHPITRFPEELKRYGISTLLGYDSEAIVAAQDVESQEGTKKTEADNDRPIVQQDLGKQRKAAVIEELRLTSSMNAILHKAGFDTIASLIDLMHDQEEQWHCAVPGIGKNTKVVVEDALAEYIQAGG